MGDGGHAHGRTWEGEPLLVNDAEDLPGRSPGCPELALATTSAARVRIVAMQVVSLRLKRAMAGDGRREKKAESNERALAD